MDLPRGTELVHTLAGHAKPIRRLAWSPDGAMLATPSEDLTLKLWDVQSGRDSATIRGHTKAVISAAWSIDGKVLATGSDDNTLRLWSVETCKEARALKCETSVPSVAWGRDQDHDYVAFGLNDGRFMLAYADPLNHKESIPLQGYRAWGLAWIPHDDITFAFAAGNTAGIWRAGTAFLWQSPLKGGNYTCLATTLRRELIACGTNKGQVMILDAQSGDTAVSLSGLSGSVRSVSFSHDEGLLAATDVKGITIIWDTVEWKARARVLTKACGRQLVNTAFSPTENLLALPDNGDTQVRLLRVDAGDLVGQGQSAVRAAKRGWWERWGKKTAGIASILGLAATLLIWFLGDRKAGETAFDTTVDQRTVAPTQTGQINVVTGNGSVVSINATQPGEGKEKAAGEGTVKEPSDVPVLGLKDFYEIWSNKDLPDVQKDTLLKEWIQLHKHTRLQCRGSVAAIAAIAARGPPGQAGYVVELKADEVPLGLACVFSADTKASLFSLKRGQRVVVSGVLTAYDKTGARIEQCQLDLPDSEGDKPH